MSAWVFASPTCGCRSKSRKRPFRTTSPARDAARVGFAWLLAGLLSASALAADPAAAFRWWKGNLHTHSLWSDGDDFPEMVADWYKRHGDRKSVV